MKGEIIHPGYIEGSQSSDTRFESFLPYIRYPGLFDPLGKRSFVSFLRKLHEITGNLWKPDNCRSVEALERGAKLLVSKRQMKFYHVSARRLDRFQYRVHFWVNLIEELGEIGNPIIVDPYGIRKMGEPPQKCCPFFGPLWWGDRFQQEVYSGGLPLDSGGTQLVILPRDEIAKRAVG